MHVVVLTPVNLSNDSRTLKQVMSLRRRGDHVTVLSRGRLVEEKELQASIDLISSGQSIADVHHTVATTPNWLRRMWEWARTTSAPIIVVLPFFGMWLLSYAYRVFVKTMPKVPNADLFILHGCSYYPAIVGRRPIIYDAHDFYTATEPENEIGTFERYLLRPFIRFIEQRCIRASSRSVTVSNGLSSLIKTTYDETPHVIRNCHDFRLDHDEKTDLRDQFGIKKDAFLIAVIGNYKKGQRISPLFQALAKLDETIHIALIGGGYTVLEDEINQHGIQHRVHNLGQVPARSIVSLARFADVAAITYWARSENYKVSLPNRFFQSLAAGIPQLYPELDEISGLARKYEIGFVVDWHSEADIYDKINTLFSNPKLQNLFAKNASFAARELCWEQEEKQWFRIVDNSRIELPSSRRSQPQKFIAKKNYL